MGKKLLEYLKPKISSLNNEELGKVLSSLVLINCEDPKIFNYLENLALRRVHSFQVAELV